MEPYFIDSDFGSTRIFFKNHNSLNGIWVNFKNTFHLFSVVSETET